MNTQLKKETNNLIEKAKEKILSEATVANMGYSREAFAYVLCTEAICVELASLREKIEKYLENQIEETK